ncbi:MAG: bacillithiol biosynthesis BshC [Planctomycetota bacterium]|nr:bacillithiol biosynthesis BshC [Planctomycetota bacterium]
MDLRLEHLPADLFGLDEATREALSSGGLNGIPVPGRLEDLPRPTDRHDAGERGLLAQALGKGHGFHELPGRARTSLSVLAEEGTFCVVAGQQPGLCASPLYSLYKGLQACRLATDLSRHWGVPVVPLFWNHGDDHDVAEVHHAHQLNRNLDLQKVKLAGLSSGRTPLSEIHFDEEVHHLSATRALLGDMYEEFEGADSALDLFFPRPGESFVRAFTRTMSELLGPMGLLVVEPDWIRPSLSSALADLVSLDPEPLLTEGSGPNSPIPPSEAALVYQVREGQRRALRPGGEGFAFDEEPGSRTASELAAEIAGQPEEWSAGALLRPLVQDAVLPVAATIGGKGELLYHAQLAPLRRAADLPNTPFVPRISMTLTSPEVRAALKRAEAAPAEVLAALGAWRPGGQSTAGEEPAPGDFLRKEAERAAKRLRSLRAEIAALPDNLAGNLERTARQVKAAIEKLAMKVDRVQANRSGKGQRALRRINHSLVPLGQPQERVLGPLQFCARFGSGWVEDLYRELPPICFEHLVVHLGSDADPSHD